MATSLLNRGICFNKTDGNKKAFEEYNAAITRFGNETEPGIREQVALAMVNRGVTLGKLKRPHPEGGSVRLLWLLDISKLNKVWPSLDCGSRSAGTIAGSPRLKGVQGAAGPNLPGLRQLAIDAT